jgi:predicted transcriptional regulator
MPCHRTPDQLRADRHAWMIDHDTGAIRHEEIAKRAHAEARRIVEDAATYLLENPKKSRAALRHWLAIVETGPELRERKLIECYMDSAKHIAWEWRVAHGDVSDSYVLSDREIQGLSTDGAVTP